MTFFPPWTILKRDLEKIFPFLWALSQENIFHELVYSADCLCVLLRSKLRCWWSISFSCVSLFYFAFLFTVFSNVIPTHSIQFSSVAQSCLFETPWTSAHQSSLSITNSQNLPKLMSIESVMPSNHLILCHPLFSRLQSFPASESFPWIGSSHQVAKHWRFSFSIRPSNEYSGLISFRMDWLDLLAVQVTLKSSPTSQFKSINSSALSFFTVQLSHPYMTTGKTTALTRWTYVGKVMFLLYNMLSRLVIAFLSISKHHGINGCKSALIENSCRHIFT